MPCKRLWVYPELTEIDLTPTYSINPLLPLKRWWQGINVRQQLPDYTPTYPIDEVGSLQHYTIERTKCSLGQNTDVADHKQKVEALNATLPELENIILYGVSRGAATTFSSLATHHYDKVKLCVIEGVPSSMSGVFKSYVKHKGFGKQLYQRIGPFFLGGQHQTDKTMQPRGHVATFPNHVPLIIISSINDEVVPHENSIRLALRVAAKRIHAKQLGETVAPVYFLQLDKVTHNYYGTHNSVDALRYQHVMHAIYQKHGLPYIETYAVKNTDNLGSMKISVDRLVFGSLKLA